MYAVRPYRCSFGIEHDLNHNDATNCPNYEYLMSTSVVHPDSNTADTYFKFSSCSAQDVQSFTAG